ncbi:MAG: hypothetical protein R2854_13450 [Caldilineaceae bacterium]
MDGAEVVFEDDLWDVEQADGSVKRVPGPREFRHTLSGVVNALASHGFVIVHLMEETSSETDPTPGTWEHYKSIAPPWLELWTRYLPDLVAGVALPRTFQRPIPRATNTSGGIPAYPDRFIAIFASSCGHGRISRVFRDICPYPLRAIFVIFFTKTDIRICEYPDVALKKDTG